MEYDSVVVFLDRWAHAYRANFSSFSIDTRLLGPNAIS